MPPPKGALESETCVQLNLAPSTDSREYSSDIVREITRSVFEDGVSIASQGKRTLRVAWHCKIRMIEQIVGSHSKCNLLALRELETLLQRQIKLCERGPAQDIASSSTKLTRRR